MTKNSIVKDYDLGFKMPTNAIGNMYAIQGMGQGDKTFPVSIDFDKSISIAALDKDAQKIAYEPFYGGLRANQLANSENANSDLTMILEQGKSLIDEGVYDVGANNSIYSGNIFEEGLGMVDANAVNSEGVLEQQRNYYNDDKTEHEQTEDQAIVDKLIQANLDKNKQLGLRISESWTDYYRIRGMSKSIAEEIPTLLPYTLSVTTYGISSIVPGDTFKVNYLPTIYLNNTFLQTTQVKHEINSSGWSTSLETQFRTIPEAKEGYYNYNENLVILSPRLIKDQNYGPLTYKKQASDKTWGEFFFRTDLGYSTAAVRLNPLLGYMDRLRLVQHDHKYIDSIIEFDITSDWKINKIGNPPEFLWGPYYMKVEGYKSISTLAGGNRYLVTELLMAPTAELKAGHKYRMVIQGDQYCFVPQNHWDKIKYLDFEVGLDYGSTKGNLVDISTGIGFGHLFFPWNSSINENGIGHNPDYLGSPPGYSGYEESKDYYPDMYRLKKLNISMKQATDKMYELLEKTAKGEIPVGGNIETAIGTRGAAGLSDMYLPYNNESGLGVDMREEIEGETQRQRPRTRP